MSEPVDLSGVKVVMDEFFLAQRLMEAWERVYALPEVGAMHRHITDRMRYAILSAPPGVSTGVEIPQPAHGGAPTNHLLIATNFST